MKETQFLRKRNIIQNDKTDLIIGFDNGTSESLVNLLKDYHESEVKKLNLLDVRKSLPDDFWFDDERGTTVTVIGTIDKWCMVKDIEHEEPYVLPLEYVTSIYEESKEGKDCLLATVKF